MDSKKSSGTHDFKKEFIAKFKSLCNTRNAWEVWADFVTASACAIANSTDRHSKEALAREQEYQKCVERMGGMDVAASMLSDVVMALTENPAQDFLGQLFMSLNLGNHWKGQFFTPYHVCEMMAEINLNDAPKIIEEQGFVSINDCACGAGATLIAAANVLQKHKINYQHHALFVAQDIDRIAGLMCYIQLSLLGCPGYVVIADSITNPVTGKILSPDHNDGQEFWFTPLYAMFAIRQHLGGNLR